MLQDRYDLEVTTDSPVARDAYGAGVDAILAASPNPAGALEQAIAADPDFALPHAAIARDHQLMGRPKEARAAAEKAVELAANATPRERQHTEILHLMVTGKGQDALALTHDHMLKWPRDAFVLAPSCGVFGLIGFSGRVGREPEQLEMLEPLATHYGDDWWFLTAHAFALLEMGQWARGREMAERSLEQFPRNAHGAHILAHTLYEGGEDKTSHQYLEEWLVDYPRDGLLHCHLWWHLCLMRLVAGDIDGMWRGYDENCAPAVSSSPSINVMSDGAALMWRAELAGQPRPTERWEMMRDYTKTTFPKPMVFIDAHGGLPYAALADEEGVTRHITQIEELAAKGRIPAGTTGIPLTKGFAAFADGNWSGAIDALEPVMGKVVRIGGSRAQRDLVTNTLLAAYVKDGRAAQARALMEAVHDRNPSVLVAGLT